MTNLPAIREVEERALLVAKQWFDHWRDHRDSDPLTDAMMTPEGSSAWVRHAMRAVAINSSLGGRLYVVMAAREGDPDADAVVQEMISVLHSRHMALPAELAAYALDRDAGLLHRRRHGPWKHTRMTRNWIIMLAVAMLVDRFGLPATHNSSTRNRPSSRRTACAIVAEAYGLMGEPGVMKIWAEFGRVGAPTVPGWSGPLFDPSGRLLIG